MYREKTTSKIQQTFSNKFQQFKNKYLKSLKYNDKSLAKIREKNEYTWWTKFYYSLKKVSRINEVIVGTIYMCVHTYNQKIIIFSKYFLILNKNKLNKLK